jgi:hypothetical protein
MVPNMSDRANGATAWPLLRLPRLCRAVRDNIASLAAHDLVAGYEISRQQRIDATWRQQMSHPARNHLGLTRPRASYEL